MTIHIHFRLLFINSVVHGVLVSFPELDGENPYYKVTLLRISFERHSLQPIKLFFFQGEEQQKNAFVLHVHCLRPNKELFTYLFIYLLIHSFCSIKTTNV